LDRYADAIGLAFQVQDDILDVISDTAILGKPQGSDEAKHKSTYPALLGLDGAQQKAQQLYKMALAALADIPYNTDSLAEFARFIIKRTH
jgi:farnesyl diphosphate synthase